MTGLKRGLVINQSSTTSPSPYLDSIHQRVVAVLQELDAELLQENSNTERRLSRQLLLFYGFPVLWPLLGLLVVVKADLVGLARALVEDHVVAGDRLHVGNSESAAKARMARARLHHLSSFLRLLLLPNHCQLPNIGKNYSLEFGNLEWHQKKLL